ncbi:lysozyme inhibitor LprI family protein [Rheinheimera faecalis]
MFYELSFRGVITLLKCFFVSMIFILKLMLFVSDAHAASFDCSLAKSMSEKIICNNNKLSKLDEDLSEQYQYQLRNATNREDVRNSQRLWLKEIHTRCGDESCYIDAYNERISFWKKSKEKIQGNGMNEYFGRNEKRDNNYNNLRFQFCRSNSNITCEETGNGYNVCEAYLKHLNNIPNNWKHGACKVWVDPKQRDISMPNWRNLDVLDNLPLIYQIVSLGKTDFQSASEWEKVFVKSIKEGTINVILKKINIELTEGGGSHDLVWFQKREVETAVCDDNDVPTGYGGRTNSDVVILNEYGKPISKVGSGKNDLLLYRGTPFFINQDLIVHDKSVSWYVGISKATKKFSVEDFPLICELINTKYGITEAR